jgi:hypothetical protein
MKKQISLIGLKILDTYLTYRGLHKYGYSIDAEWNPVVRGLMNKLGVGGYFGGSLILLILASFIIVKYDWLYYPLLVIFIFAVLFNTGILIFI